MALTHKQYGENQRLRDEDHFLGLVEDAWISVKI